MGRRRRIALLALCVASATLVVGSGAFTSTSAERPVSVDVVGDDEAYMSLEYEENEEVPELSAGESTKEEYLTVRNRFGQSVTIDVDAVTTVSGGLDVDVTEKNRSLGLGNEMNLSADFTCNDPGGYEPEIQFEVSATGDGVYAETGQDRTVTFDVSCPADETTTTTDE